MRTTNATRRTRATTKPKAYKTPQRHYTDLPVNNDALYVGRLQAAHLLGVNVQTIDQWIATNRVRAYKPARRVLISREDLLKLVEGARV
jgi:excisionase family DNA binding protein